MTIGDTLALGMMVAAIFVAAVNRGQARRVALSIAVGIAATRLAVWYVPSDWRFLASAAVWICVGVDAIRRHVATTGALMIASGLCYAGAEMLAAPAKFGNPALVGADVFWWAGLAGVVLHGGISGLGARRGMGVADRGGSLLAGRRGGGMVAKEAGR